MRCATQLDRTMSDLKALIMDGWPNHRSDLPQSVTPYFTYRDELTVQDGIVLRGERVVIPTSMRPEIIQKVHAGHMGINSCLRRARELVYWPGMLSEIRQFVETCDACATFYAKQTPETLHMSPAPSRPFQKVGTDLFSINEKNYLITVDYYSHFFEVDYLPDLSATTVITKLKHHFARHGIPDVVVSDCGTQYTSANLKKFSDEWRFKHAMASPGTARLMGQLRPLSR